MKKIVVLLSFLLANYVVSAQDLRVNFIVSPSTACGHTNAETVSIQLFNADPVTAANPPYTISYQVNGGPVVTQAVAAGDIVPPSSFLPPKSFATPVNMTTPGVYNFKAWVTHPTDANHANDTSTKVVNSDANTIPGVAQFHDTVCTGVNGDTIRLTGFLGTVTGWLANGVAVPSATDTFVEYSNLTQTTSFVAIVRNGTCPFDTSAPAIITVDTNSDAGVITGPVSACIGSSGALTLTGSKGNVLDWETAVNLAGPWSGATNTTTTFNFTNIQLTDDTLFRAIVKLGVCPADTSPVKTLNLDVPSVGGTVSQTAGTNPVCATANTGDLSLTGEIGTVVEWQSSTGGPFAAIGGTAGLTTITFNNLAQTTTFRALVQNGACAPIPSTTVTINVDQPSVGGTISNDATVCTGSNFGTLNLSGHVGNVIRWDSSNIAPGGPYSAITNTTTNQNYSNLTLTTYYRAVVQNGVCPPIASATASITVNSVSVGGTITPGGATTVCANNNNDILTVAGINGTIQQWETSTNNGASWTNTGIATNTFSYTNITDTTLFRVLVKNGACPGVYSDTLEVIVLPASLAGVINGTANVCAGTAASLTLTGHDGTVVKWRVSTNGGASYSDAGGIGSTTLNPVVASTSQYIAIVQLGGCNPDTTAPFVVTTNSSTVGGTVGPSATKCFGSSHSFTLSGHTGTVVRWERSFNFGATWSSIGAGGLTTISLSNITDTILVRAIVKNGACPIDSSSFATVTIIPQAIGGNVTIDPPNDTVCEGTYTVVLNLNNQMGNIVRWESSTGGAFVNEGVSGNPQAFIGRSFTTDTKFRAIIQNGVGCPMIPSDTATVVVNPLTVAGSISAASTTVCGGSNTGTINLVGSVGAVIRWEESVNFGPFNPVIPPNTTTSLSYSGLNDTTQYRVIVKSGECAQLISDTALIQVIPAAIGGSVTGASAGPLCVDDTNLRTLTLIASFGTIEAWQSSPDGTVWTDIGNAGSTTLDYRASTLGQTTHFRARLKDGACPAVFSVPDTVFVNPLSDAGLVNGAANLCDTGNTGFVHITGYTGTVLGWLSSTDGTVFVPVAASANDTLFYNNLIDTTYYRAIVQNSPCENDTSAIVTVNVSPNTVAGTLTGGTSYCNLTNNTLLELTGFTGSTFVWQESVNSGPFVTIAGASLDTLRRIDVTQSTTYRVIVSSGACGMDTSTTTTIDVGTTIAGTINSSATYCDTINGDTLILTGYVGVVQNWEISTDGITFTPLAPAHTSDSLIYLNLQDTTYYRAIVQSAGCPADTSDTATVTVDPLAIGGMLSSSISFCDTVNHDTLLLTGYQGNIVNWEFSTDTGKTWTPMAPVLTIDTFIFTDIKTTTQFRVLVSTGGSCPDSLSNVVTIGIGPAQAGTISGINAVCSGTNSDTLRLNNQVGDSIVWQVSADSIAWNNSGSTESFQPFANLSATTFYRVIVVNDTCGVDTSAGFRINVTPRTTAGTITGDDRVCFNDTTEKTLILTGTIGTIIHWESLDTGTVWVNIPNPTDTQRYKNLEFQTMYRVIVQNGICPNDTANVTVFVDSLSIAGNLTGQDTVCAFTNAGTIFTTGSRGIDYLWESSTNGSSWTTVTTADTFFTYSGLIDTTMYRLVVDNGGCPADTSDTVAVLVKPAAIGGTILSDSSFCEGPNAGTLNLTGHVGNITQWEFSTDGTNFTPVANTLPTLAYNNVSQTTFYRAVIALGDCPNAFSDTATITIFPLPSASISADGPLEFCEGGSVTLTATGGPTYSWSTGVTDSAITVSSTGTYIVTVTDTSTTANCMNFDSIAVNVFPLPTIVASQDTSVDLGNDVVISATGGSTYSWSPTIGLSNSISPNPSASPTITTLYVVTGTDENGCIGADSLTVTVNTESTPEFTNLFTPDGDGINDTWVIGNILNCNSCKLAVYNRYGQEVYSASNYQNDWKGTFEGKDLPDGTYYFVLQSSETGKTYKGAVTILRGE